MRNARIQAPTLQFIATTTPGSRQSDSSGPPVVNLTLHTDDRLLLTVVDAARRLEISRSLLYELLATGELESIHVGRLRRVPAEALAAYVERQRSQRPDPAA